MSASLPTVSVLIPVYRSEGTLEPLTERLTSILGSFRTPFEIIFINDDSPDKSWTAILELQKKYSNIKAIDLTRNFGQQNALLCGIRMARNEVIITMDADLQHPPDEIPRLLEKIQEGYDVVYGTPMKEKQTLFRNLSSWIIKVVMQNVMGVKGARLGSSFRAFRTQLREAFKSYQAPFVSIDVLLSWGTTRFCSIPVKHDPRAVGKSSYSFRKLIFHCFNILTGFSTLPLQMASLIGFFFTLFGVGVLVYVVGRYLILGYSFPGFPFLASIIAIFSGAQLFALGIIGEYLARIHFRIMERPPYVIRQTIDKQ